jgi:hypothetical protein
MSLPKSKHKNTKIKETHKGTIEMDCEYKIQKPSRVRGRQNPQPGTHSSGISSPDTGSHTAPNSLPSSRQVARSTVNAAITVCAMPPGISRRPTTVTLLLAHNHQGKPC